MTTMEDIYANNIEVREVRSASNEPLWQLQLKIDHQSFPIGLNCEQQYDDKAHAQWTGRQLAIALYRLTQT